MRLAAMNSAYFMIPENVTDLSLRNKTAWTIFYFRQ